MTRHYQISPSALNRLLNCPGSRTLAADLPDVESRYAADGTRLHELVAERIEGTRTADGIEDDEDRDAVQVCLDEFRRRCESLGEVTELHVERTLESQEVDGLGGTPDCVIIGTRGPDVVAIVIDWKFGSGVRVVAEGNAQLCAYALLVVEHHPEVDYVAGVICQPLVDNGVSEIDIYRAELIKLIGDIHTSLGSDELCAGSHCRFCKANLAGICPAVNRLAVTAAQADFSEVPNDDEVHLALDLVNAKAAILKRLDVASETLLNAMRLGVDVPGMKAVMSLGNRTWAMDDEATLKALCKLGIAKREATETRLLSPPQLLKAKPDADLSALIVRPQRGYRIVPVTASGDAVTLGINEFTAVEE